MATKKQVYKALDQYVKACKTQRGRKRVTAATRRKDNQKRTDAFDRLQDVCRDYGRRAS